MWAEVNRILRQATTQVADHVANFLPGVLVSVLLILTAFLVAVCARLVVLRVLRGIEFDRRADQLGLSPLTARPASSSLSVTVARVVYWVIVFLGLLASLTALNATIPSKLALSIFAYLPNLLAALMILVGGALAARFLARSVLIGAVNMQLHWARLMSLTVKWVVLIVAGAMALDHLGIGRGILPLAFGIFFGGVVLAAALAIGLGARDAVGRAIERQLTQTPRHEDHVDHV